MDYAWVEAYVSYAHISPLFNSLFYYKICVVKVVRVRLRVVRVA